MSSFFPQSLEITIKLQPLISELSKRPNSLPVGGQVVGIFLA
ncbi:MAG: hypothetical protein RLZZ540_1817 [Bacteroidota bacterium]|jgi:hypothetical protein